MNTFNKSEIVFLLNLIEREAEKAQKSLSEGLFSDDTDRIGHGSAVLRQLDTIRSKLEKMSIDI